jgi:hypothetical protein
MPWLTRKLRPAAIAIILSTVLCSGAVLTAVTLFFASQLIAEDRP